MSPISQAIRRARQRITQPSQWCRGAWAKDATGKSVSSGNAAAVSWCAEGALMVETGRDIMLYVDCMTAINRLTPRRSASGKPIELICVNDNELFFAHHDVLEVLDTVSNRLDAEEAADAYEAERMGAEILRAMTTPIDVEVACVTA